MTLPQKSGPARRPSKCSEFGQELTGAAGPVQEVEAAVEGCCVPPLPGSWGDSQVLVFLYKRNQETLTGRLTTWKQTVGANRLEFSFSL